MGWATGDSPENGPGHEDTSPEPPAHPVLTPQSDLDASTTFSHPPNPGPPADRRGEVARWVVGLSEPLLAPEQRTRVETDMAAFVDRNSAWASAYLAGILNDLTHTLPPDDPWRNLSALIDLQQVSTGRLTSRPELRLAIRSGQAPLPAVTGAVRPDGAAFGTLLDSADLLEQELPDPTQDVGLAPLTPNLSPLSAALVGFAAGDAQTLHFVLSKVHHHLWEAHFSGLIDQSPGSALLGATSAALRWLTHRRCCYLSTDSYVAMLGFAWIAKADRVTTGRSILEEGGLDLQGMIPPEMYRELAMPPDQPSL